MDLEKFKVLTDLIKDAKLKDKETFKIMSDATTAWKAANQVLTDRNKVFDEFVSSEKAQATALE